MRYLSVCSGIEAASVAWRPLGWQAAAFAEIEPQPSAVLAHHYPDVPNHGDFTTIKGDEYGTIDLIVGGTPCQSFSVAGFREGLDDDRGNLALEYVRLVDRVRPNWIVWENVPGVLSTNGGRDFGAIIGALAKCGYCCAWRVLDAQYVRVQSHKRGVPQRRRRVFVVGHLGDRRPPAAVLFDPEGLRRDTPPSRQAGEKVANTVASNLGTGGFNNPDFVTAVSAKWAKGASGPSGDECKNVVAFDTRQDPIWREECAGPVSASRPVQAVANSVGTHPARHDHTRDNVVLSGMTLRRITPLECERLQGLPDNYTKLEYHNKTMSDSARYRMIGNSMAVNVMRWIGERIQMFEDLNSPS